MRRNLRRGERFAILQRDDWRCQYCGAAAPDAQLDVDHVYPVAWGGDNDPENLVTACVACNSGKSANRLWNPVRGRWNDADLYEVEAALWIGYRVSVPRNAEWLRDVIGFLTAGMSAKTLCEMVEQAGWSARGKGPEAVWEAFRERAEAVAGPNPAKAN